jgi:hypothetical protein
MFSVCYSGKISRFARNDKLLRLFTTLSTIKLLGLSQLLLAIRDAVAADVAGHFHIIPDH